MKRYTPPRTIAIDVDGTLVKNSKLNRKLVQWISRKRGDGYSVYLWSAAGEKHARKTADKYKVTALFDQIISKPGYIVDDLGKSWLRNIRTVAPK